MFEKQRQRNLTDIQIPEERPFASQRRGSLFYFLANVSREKTKSCVDKGLWTRLVDILDIHMGPPYSMRRIIQQSKFGVWRRHGEVRDSFRHCQRIDPISSIFGTPFHYRRHMYMPPWLYITRLFYSAVAKFVCDVYTRPFLFFLFLLPPLPFRQTIICK